MLLTYKATLYKQQQDNLEYMRIVEGPAGLRKISGIISRDRGHQTIQSITQAEHLGEHTPEETVKAWAAEGFESKFVDKADVLFVQLQLSGKDTMELLELRHQTEVEIDRRLSANGMGRFIAGDLGPGGANMLFETDDWATAFQLIIERLNEAGLASNCLIAKRIYTSEDNWAYDLVYPVAYEGVFNEM